MAQKKAVVTYSSAKDTVAKEAALKALAAANKNLKIEKDKTPNDLAAALAQIAARAQEIDKTPQIAARAAEAQIAARAARAAEADKWLKGHGPTDHPSDPVGTAELMTRKALGHHLKFLDEKAAEIQKAADKIAIQNWLKGYGPVDRSNPSLAQQLQDKQFFRLKYPDFNVEEPLGRGYSEDYMR